MDIKEIIRRLQNENETQGREKKDWFKESV